MLVLTDISPEEVRYSVYEAKKVNRFSEEVIKIKNIKKLNFYLVEILTSSFNSFNRNKIKSWIF